MPTVNDVLRTKGHSLVGVDVSATVIDAVRAMNDHHIGAVLITDALGAVVGIFTERDVLRRIVAAGLDPLLTPVRKVMTPNVISCDLFTDLDDIARTMQSRRIRHLPIRDADERVVGVISIGDINAFNVSQKQATIESMTNYICGRA